MYRGLSLGEWRGHIQKAFDVPKENILMTGSRFFGDEHRDSDLDAVILVDDLEDVETTVSRWGYLECGETYVGDVSKWYICRKKDDSDINLIFTNCEQGFGAWKACQRIAKELNLPREERKEMFSIGVRQVDKDS